MQMYYVRIIPLSVDGGIVNSLRQSISRDADYLILWWKTTHCNIA